MARFYVLPPRSFVGQQYASLLREFFPGRPIDRYELSDLAESLAANVEKDPHAIVIFEEDLADDAPVEIVLRRDFGAEPGDEIIDIRVGARVAPPRRAAA
jgi:hypothetical protein